MATWCRARHRTRKHHPVRRRHRAISGRRTRKSNTKDWRGPEVVGRDEVAHWLVRQHAHGRPPCCKCQDMGSGGLHNPCHTPAGVDAAGPPAGDRRLPGSAMAWRWSCSSSRAANQVCVRRASERLHPEFRQKRGLERAPESLLFALIMRTCAQSGQSCFTSRWPESCLSPSHIWRCRSCSAFRERPRGWRSIRPSLLHDSPTRGQEGGDE